MNTKPMDEVEQWRKEWATKLPKFVTTQAPNPHPINIDWWGKVGVIPRRREQVEAVTLAALTEPNSKLNPKDVKSIIIREGVHCRRFPKDKKFADYDEDDFTHTDACNPHITAFYYTGEWDSGDVWCYAAHIWVKPQKTIVPKKTEPTGPKSADKLPVGVNDPYPEKIEPTDTTNNKTNSNQTQWTGLKKFPKKQPKTPQEVRAEKSAAEDAEKKKNEELKIANEKFEKGESGDIDTVNFTVDWFPLQSVVPKNTNKTAWKFYHFRIWEREQQKASMLDSKKIDH